MHSIVTVKLQKVVKWYSRKLSGLQWFQDAINFLLYKAGLTQMQKV